jgi:rhodanese-related sulfurtransferase
MKVINDTANKYKVIAQNTAALSDELNDATNFSRYSFFSSFSCDQIGRGIAYYYAQIRKKEKKFYILCQDYMFGHSMAEGFKKGLKQYYPDAQIVHLKLIFRCPDGLILGAQAIGEQGVERRIDVISLAIQKGATVFDLEEAELCYAPQFGSAKDPVNLAGMVAANVLRGDVSVAKWSDLARTDALLLDVREEEEFRHGAIDGTINIPLDQLRSRLCDLPRNRPIWVNCARGHRSYYAVRILQQNGFAAHNLSGGYNTWELWYPDGMPSGEEETDRADQNAGTPSPSGAA